MYSSITKNTPRPEVPRYPTRAPSSLPYTGVKNHAEFQAALKAHPVARDIWFPLSRTGVYLTFIARDELYRILADLRVHGEVSKARTEDLNGVGRMLFREGYVERVVDNEDTKHLQGKKLFDAFPISAFTPQFPETEEL